jgi:hypothetical protein
LKTLLKTLVLLVIINVLYKTGVVAWDYYRLRDEAQQIIIFGGKLTTEAVAERILSKALDLHIPLEPENLDVQRDGDRTFVWGAYQQPVELFPNISVSVDLSFNLDNFSVEPF